MEPRSSSGARFLLLDPAMGFGPRRLVMAPARFDAARLPRGVHAVPAAVSGARLGLTLSASPASSRRGTFSVGALPMGGRATTTTSFLGAPPNALEYAVAAAVAGAGSSSTRKGGRRVVVASGAAITNTYPSSDDSNRAAERIVLSYDNLRAGKHIAAWVYLARLRTMFEVAFDAGALESGRDLRKSLEVIGEIDPAARIHPWTTDACLAHLRAVIGEEKLEMLRSARTPESDTQFVWSATTAEALILATQHLMGTLYSVIILNEGWLRPSPPCLLYESCPMFLKRLIESVEEFSVIVESTKFRRPQNSIRFRILEEHALALEHLYAIGLDIYKEVYPTEPEGEDSEQIGSALRHRRVTLFEQDVGLTDYMLSIGLSDSRSVIRHIDHICWVLRESVLGPGFHLF